MHYIRVYADTSQTIAAAAQNAGSCAWQSFPFGPGVVGVISIEAISQRQTLRNDATILIFPNAASPADISKHAKKMNLPQAKTARDIHAAVFAALNLDHFDPDL